MLRRIVALSTIGFAFALVGIWVLSPPAKLAATFEAEDCRRVELRHDVTEALIVGAEDLALTADLTHVIVSAHDRRDRDLPSGGLYAVSLSDLVQADTITVKRVYSGDTRAVAFRPHGIALSTDGQRLVLINRPTDGEAEIQIGSLDQLEWNLETRVTGKRLCRANDLSFINLDTDDLRISLDRGSCETSYRDLMPGAATGKVVRFDGQGIVSDQSDLAFPNGVLPDVLAETRAMQLRLGNGSLISLPGGPDNLSVDDNGWVVAALHPKLLNLWMHRRGWQATAPSRIVRVDPTDGAIEILFDDPEASLFSAATAAVYSDGLLVAGSAYDSGLLVCEQGLR